MKITFGEHLQNIRRAKNLSQEELAELCEISREAVSFFERDINTPRLPTLIKLADILTGGCIDDLVYPNS